MAMNEHTTIPDCPADCDSFVFAFLFLDGYPLSRCIRQARAARKNPDGKEMRAVFRKFNRDLDLLLADIQDGEV